MQTPYNICPTHSFMRIKIPNIYCTSEYLLPARSPVQSTLCVCSEGEPYRPLHRREVSVRIRRVRSHGCAIAFRMFNLWNKKNRSRKVFRWLRSPLFLWLPRDIIEILEETTKSHTWTHSTFIMHTYGLYLRPLCHASGTSANFGVRKCDASNGRMLMADTTPSLIYTHALNESTVWITVHHFAIHLWIKWNEYWRWINGEKCDARATIDECLTSNKWMRHHLLIASQWYWRWWWWPWW